MTAVADALVVLGLLIVTVSVYGAVWLPDVLHQLHAAGKAGFLGVVAILIVAALSAGAEAAGRAVLIVALLTVTAPVSAHAVARLAHISESDEEPVDRPGDPRDGRW